MFIHSCVYACSGLPGAADFYLFASFGGRERRKSGRVLFPVRSLLSVAAGIWHRSMVAREQGTVRDEMVPFRINSGLVCTATARCLILLLR